VAANFESLTQAGKDAYNAAEYEWLRAAASSVPVMIFEDGDNVHENVKAAKKALMAAGIAKYYFQRKALGNETPLALSEIDERFLPNESWTLADLQPTFKVVLVAVLT